MQETQHPDEPGERFTEIVTDSIETNYQNGEIDNVVVTATWRRGNRASYDGQIAEDLDDEVTIEAKYVLDDRNVAELHAFYPDTTKTGEQLKRENVKCLRVLSWVYDVVRSHLDDDVTVVAPYICIRNEMGQQ